MIKWDEILERTLSPEAKKVHTELKKIHYLNWEEFKYADWTSKEENMAAAKLAKEIVSYLV